MKDSTTSSIFFCSRKYHIIRYQSCDSGTVTPKKANIRHDALEARKKVFSDNSGHYEKKFIEIRKSEGSLEKFPSVV